MGPPDGHCSGDARPSRWRPPWNTGSPLESEMQLRYRVPVGFYVVGPNEGSLTVRIPFDHHGLACVATVETGQPLSGEDLPPEARHFARAEHLSLLVADEAAAHPIWSWVANGDLAALVVLLRQIANRCIRGIRNSGIVPGLRELDEDGNDPEPFLRRWKVEVTEHGQWRPMLPEPEVSGVLAALLGSTESRVYGELRTQLLPLIEEAIQEDLHPRPEVEFTTNAVEHLRLNNQRFAVLEAIIGLEIVLARFLQLYLKVRKGLSKTRIEKALSPDLGLTARVAGVLALVLTKDQVEQAGIEKVLSAINWRNTIVHRTGKLPEGLPAETVRSGVLAVLGLTGLLADEADRIEAEPDMDVIASTLTAGFPDLPRPSMRYLGSHSIGIWYTHVGLDDNWVPRGRMEEIAATVKEVRVRQDRRFDPAIHLQMVFQTIPGGNAVRWHAGALGPLQGAGHPPSAPH